MQPQQIEIIKLIESECQKLGLPDSKIDYLVSYINASVTEEKGDNLPDEIHTGVDFFDYLVAPLSNTSRIHICGPAGTGKTALIAHLCESLVSKYNSKILWIDSSFKLNSKFFKKFKLYSNNKLSFFQTTTINRDILQFIRTEKYRIVVLDDIASINDNQEYFQLLHMAKIYRIIVLAANQIRVHPHKKYVYSAKHELIKDFDVMLKMNKHQAVYDEKYNDFDLKLEYHQSRGGKEGVSVVVPITTAGYVIKELASKRVSFLTRTETGGKPDVETVITQPT